MANELTTGKSGDMISLIGKKEIGEILKPLIREIHLFDTYIAGTTYLEDRAVLERIQIGDRLSLQREDNKFDEHAILVLNEEKKKLGYIPEKDNLIFARLMDAGKTLCAKIDKITPKGVFTQISIGIYLIDF